MTTSRKDRLATILDMSLSMLDLARAQEWEQLERIEGERRGLVAECFRTPATPEEAPGIADGIRRILDVNQEITALTEARRDELGKNIHSLGSAREARKAYSQHL